MSRIGKIDWSNIDFPKESEFDNWNISKPVRIKKLNDKEFMLSIPLKEKGLVNLLIDDSISDLLHYKYVIMTTKVDLHSLDIYLEIIKNKIQK